MIRSIFFTILFAIAALTAPLGGPAQAQDLGASLRSVHLDPGFRQELRQRGFTGAHFEVMVDNLRLLYSDRTILAGLERNIAAAWQQSGGQLNDRFFAQVDGLLSNAEGIGRTRLSAAERHRVLTFETNLVRSLPARDCTKMMRGRASPVRTMQLADRYMLSIPASQLADYLALSRKATALGLRPGASPRQLTATEVARAEEVIFPQIDAMMSRQKNAADLYRAWNRGPAGVERYMCTFYQMFSIAALNARGATGDLAVRYVMGL